MISLEQSGETPIRPAEESKIYCDGVFDLMHSGHFNALRQARKQGTFLAVGVCSDGEVRLAKHSRPIFSAEERAEIIRECRWVDRVIVGTPYDVSSNYLQNVVKCDFVTHGDDFAPGTSGKDCYSDVRDLGLLKIFKRTKGVSTSLLVRRIINGLDALDRKQHGIIKRDSLSEDQLNSSSPGSLLDGCRGNSGIGSALGVSGPISSSVDTRRMLEFVGHNRLAGCQKRVENRSSVGRIIYVWGHFDVMNVGFVRFLKEAKKHGDYLIVGLWSDALIASLWGENFPVLSGSERCMNLYALRCVDELVESCPLRPDNELIERLGIDAIVIPTVVPHLDDCETSAEHGVLEYVYNKPFNVNERTEFIQISNAARIFEMRPLLHRVAEQLKSVNYSELISTRLKAEHQLYQCVSDSPGIREF